MGFLSSLNPLVKLAKKVVNMVRRQLMQQVDLLDSAVQAPIQAIVSQVTGGIWTGRGADAFVEACTKLAIPGTEGIKSDFRTMEAGLGKAVEVMDTADAKATGVFRDLGDTFRGIF